MIQKSVVSLQVFCALQINWSFVFKLVPITFLNQIAYALIRYKKNNVKYELPNGLWYYEETCIAAIESYNNQHFYLLPTDIMYFNKKIQCIILNKCCSMNIHKLPSKLLCSNFNLVLKNINCYFVPQLSCDFFRKKKHGMYAARHRFL